MSVKNEMEEAREYPEIRTVLDTIGLYCPEPIFRLRTAVDEMKNGEILEMLSDDPAAEEDVKRWAKRTGNRILGIGKDDSVLRFIIEKTSKDVEDIS